MVAYINLQVKKGDYFADLEQLNKMIEYKDTENWLGSDVDMTELIGMITDIANGLYTPENLLLDIKEYKEHND